MSSEASKGKYKLTIRKKQPDFSSCKKGKEIPTLLFKEHLL